MIWVLLLAREKKWGEIIQALPVYLGMYVIYFVYCAWFAGNPLAVVGGAGIGAAGIGTVGWDGFGSVAGFFSVGRIVERSFGSGWMIWLSLTLMAPVIRKNWAIVGPILSYALVMGLVLGGLPDYGWYRIPLYPFLCIAGAVFVVDMVQRPDLFRAVIFTILALLTSARYAAGDLFQSPWTFRWALLFALLPFALHFSLRESRTRAVAQGVAVLLVAFFVLANVGVVVRFLSVYLGG